MLLMLPGLLYSVLNLQHPLAEDVPCDAIVEVFPGIAIVLRFVDKGEMELNCKDSLDWFLELHF